MDIIEYSPVHYTTLASTDVWFIATVAIKMSIEATTTLKRSVADGTTKSVRSKRKLINGERKGCGWRDFRTFGNFVASPSII